MGRRGKWPEIDPERIAYLVLKGARPPSKEFTEKANELWHKWKPTNKAKAIQRPGELNKTEARREVLLELRRCAGFIQGFDSQCHSLRLGKGCWYRPDFIVIEADGTFTFEEVKGKRGWQLDKQGRVKWKLAAERFPYYRFRGVIWDGDTWSPEEASPSSSWPRVRPD